MNYEESRIQREYEERLQREQLEDMLSRALLNPPPEESEES